MSVLCTSWPNFSLILKSVNFGKLYENAPSGWVPDSAVCMKWLNNECRHFDYVTFNSKIWNEFWKLRRRVIRVQNVKCHSDNRLSGIISDIVYAFVIVSSYSIMIFASIQILCWEIAIQWFWSYIEQWSLLYVWNPIIIFYLSSVFWFECGNLWPLE